MITFVILYLMIGMFIMLATLAVLPPDAFDRYKTAADWVIVAGSMIAFIIVIPILALGAILVAIYTRLAHRRQPDLP